MGINVIDPAGTDRSITGINVVDAAGTDRSLVQINVIDPAGTDRLVWSSAGAGTFAVSVTPNSVLGTTTTTTATTNTTAASASGGTPPYTYAWTILSYDNVTPPTITSPSGAATKFTQTGIGYNETYTATFQVTAHDSASHTATANVSAEWDNLSGGRGPIP
jgi:hypothetical protein